nr:unnamed protein product [Callosobruchus chinensis]
MYRLCK